MAEPEKDFSSHLDCSSDQSSKSTSPLKGKELLDYFDGHKEGTGGDGDALCIGAGYGEYSEDGKVKCNFPPFVKELDKAMELNKQEEISS